VQAGRLVEEKERREKDLTFLVATAMISSIKYSLVCASNQIHYLNDPLLETELHR